IQLVALFVSVALLLAVLELVRRRRLDERYSLAWLLAGTVVLIFSAFRDLQLKLADAVGVFYAPALVYGGLIFFLLVVTLHLSTVTSRLESRNRQLAQRIALLEHELRASTIGAGENNKAPHELSEVTAD
ncbi:MAG: DUF2304 domain-containing protein, partial [Acidobacteriaceae bacterium]|nr:DUF2304 domain-containing protein [Acidobacteriaceae bacterium]